MGGRAPSPSRPELNTLCNVGNQVVHSVGIYNLTIYTHILSVDIEYAYELEKAPNPIQSLTGANFLDFLKIN